MKITAFRSLTKYFFYIGNFDAPALAVTTLIAYAMTLLNLVNQYIFGDWLFAGIFVALFVLNSLSGAYKALRFKDISLAAFFWGILDRAVAYLIIFPITYILVNFPISGDEANVIFTYMKHIVYVAAMGYEGQEAFKNVFKWLPKLFDSPAMRNIFKNFRGFDDEGKMIQSKHDEKH